MLYEFVRGPQTAWPEWHCPEHGATLDGVEGELRCHHGESYVVRNGIPRFVPGSSYASAFGLQWRRYTRTQLDSFTGTTITQDRLRRCLGDELFFSLAGKHVLETGCGAGRFTEVLLNQGACVTSVDLSDAVDANRVNFAVGERHRIAQADIMRLPFARRQFDVVICLGVIQHTPDPEETIRQLYEQVRPGGVLVIDHYVLTLYHLTNTGTLLRPVLKRLRPEFGMRVTEAVVKTLFPIHKAVRRRRLARAVVSRLSPVLTYFNALPQLDDAQQYEWALLDTHDALTDYHKHFRTARQIRRALAKLGLVDLWVARGGNGVEARGRRPA